MITGLKVTDRDRALLYDCYSHAVMSFSQIHKRHFEGRSVATVSNRLGKLTRAGLLKRTRAGVSFLLDDRNEVGVVYQLTRKAHSYLGAFRRDESIRSEPHRLNLANLTHDLLLNDTIAALSERFPGRRIAHGRLHPVQNGSGKRHPDAILLDHSGQPYTAIELELTAKSDTRYRSIVIQYMTSREYRNVLYIIGGSAVTDRISYQITQRKKLPNLPAPSTGKFFFVRLSDLLKNPRIVSISNGSEEFSIN